MAKNKVPNAVVHRLPGYYRYLTVLEEIGLVRISSQQLGDRMGLTASQIRQDINCFGGFGQQGYGYNVTELRQQIGEILGLNREYHMVIAGAGNIGQAVSNYASFRGMRFFTDALFDQSSDVVGRQVGNLTVKPISELSEYLRKHTVDIGVIATPKGAAQGVSDALVAGGVRAIWNFAPVDIVVPENVAIRSVHLSDALLVLSYHMNND